MILRKFLNAISCNHDVLQMCTPTTFCLALISLLALPGHTSPCMLTASTSLIWVDTTTTTPAGSTALFIWPRAAPNGQNGRPSSVLVFARKASYVEHPVAGTATSFHPRRMAATVAAERTAFGATLTLPCTAKSLWFLLNVWKPCRQV